MHLKRKRIPDQGDVVLLEFPGARLIKRRPAVVLSSAQYHAERPDVIVGLITSQLVYAKASTDHVLEDWRHVGLDKPSVYRTFLATVPRSAINRNIGKLSGRDWQSVRKCLQISLGFR